MTMEEEEAAKRSLIDERKTALNGKLEELYLL